MQIVGPETLAIGSANTVDDPAQSGGNPSAAVQIQNSSSYQLSVLAAGETLSLQPFTAQTIEISGQPIVVTPVAGSGSGACKVTFVFLLTTAPDAGVQLPSGTWVETPPQQDGPLTAAAIAAAISGFVSTAGAMDELSTGAYTLSGAGTVTTAVVNLTNLAKCYAALFLIAFPTGGASVISVGANDGGANWSAGAVSQPGLIGTKVICPFANQVGDNATFTIYSLAASGDTGTYALFGLTSCPVDVRPDGLPRRPLPLTRRPPSSVRSPECALCSKDSSAPSSARRTTPSVVISLAPSMRSARDTAR